MEKTTIAQSCEIHARIGWQGLTKKEYLDEGDYYLITGVDFNNGHISFDKCHYVTKDRFEQDPHIQIRQDDVLVTKDGTIGKVAIIDEPISKPATLNSGVFVVRPKDTDILIPKYLMYVLLSNNFVKFIDQIKVGCTIAHLNQEKFLNFEFPIPNIEKQRLIIQIFDTLYSIVDSRKKEMEKLDDLVKARFVEMFGTIQNNVFGFADGTLESVSDEFFAGGDKPSDCITEKDSAHSYPVFANGYENEGLQGYSAKCRVNKPAVTVSARGTIGYCFIRDAGFTPIVRLVTIVPNNKVSVVFLKYAIDTMEIKSSGTSQAQLTVPDFKRERIIVPPIQLQEQFSTFVAQVDKSKVVVQKALDEAQLLFDSLMQQYFG